MPTPIMGGLGTVGLPVPVMRPAYAGATLVMTNAPLTPAHSGGHEVTPAAPRTVETVKADIQEVKDARHGRT